MLTFSLRSFPVKKYTHFSQTFKINVAQLRIFVVSDLKLLSISVEMMAIWTFFDLAKVS